MDRRGFLGSILALGAAPAIVRADSLMRIVPRGEFVLYQYQEEIARTIWDTETFHEIMSEKYLKHYAEMKANVLKHNALTK